MYHLEKDLGIYLEHYDNLLILGDLKSELKENCWNDFSNSNNLKSFNKETTCLKNPNNALCTNLYLPNRPGYLQNNFTIETVISDFNKLVATEIQMFHKKQKPKLFNYKTFKEQLFRTELDKELAKPGLSSDVLAEFAVNFHQC